MTEQALIEQRYDSRLAALANCGQDHLLTFWNDLNPTERSALLSDLDQINYAELPSLVRQIRSRHVPPHNLDLAPPVVIQPDSLSQSVVERGRELLATGRIAALTVAGGQGTRLGFSGPKGAFPISPLRNKTLFQLFAEAIRATSRRYGRACRWYIMTSPANDAETQSYFRKMDFFGLDSNQIVFFQQGVMPAFDRDARILLDERHRVALSPDGHGGSLLAMASRGVLADMAERGIETISYFQVDNPLVHCLDPLFLGLHDQRGSDMSGKTLPKADDLERVGNFAMSGGRLTVIEYSDLPEEMARSRNPDGSRRFDAANIAIHVLSRSFVERLTSDRRQFALPWHRAEKKVPFVDLTSGVRVEPDAVNAVKLESFVFDALPLARNPVLLATRREEEFSPVKNAIGTDSVETAQRDMVRRAARWIEAAGVKVPQQSNGVGSYEISPLFALDADQLASRGTHALEQLLSSGRTYLD